MTFTLGTRSSADAVLNNRKGKSVEQGGILSPFLFNIFDSQIMTEFERRCVTLGLDARILGYADDHVICVRDASQIKLALETFADVCAEFGMLLEMSKTEYVCSAHDHSQTPLALSICGKNISLQSKQKVKWLGFNLDLTTGHLNLHLGCLTKLHVYLSDLKSHVDTDTFKAIYRTYIQSSLNYFFVAATYLGGSSLSKFFEYEAKFRSVRDVSSLPKTADICQNQLHKLNNTYPIKNYNLRNLSQ